MPFKILHNNSNEGHNLRFGYDEYRHAEIHFIQDLVILTSYERGEAHVIKINISKGIDFAKVVDRKQIPSNYCPKYTSDESPQAHSVMKDNFLYFLIDRKNLVKFNAITLEIIK